MLPTPNLVAATVLLQEGAPSGRSNRHRRRCLWMVQVQKEDIERFEEEYRGSEEELKDLKELYTRFEGDMRM